MAIEKNYKDTKGVDLNEYSGTTGEPAMVTEYDDGTSEFDYDYDEDSLDFLQQGVMNTDEEHFKNIAEDLDDDALNIIGEDVVETYMEDKESSKEWMETAASGLKLLGTKIEENSDPFPGACGAHHPLILESAVKFQAKAMEAMYPAKGPVKAQVLGADPEGAKEEQAKRVRNHMNWQFMDQMEEYFDETESMLFYLPIVGSGIKKIYYNALLDRPCAEFIKVDQFIVNYHATNLSNASSMTHVIHRSGNDLKKDIKAGLYRDCDLSIYDGSYDEQGDISIEEDDLMGYHATRDDTVYTLLEHYCYLDLPGKYADPDGIALPYVVTVELDSGKVLSIRRNWKEDDETFKRICPFVHYKFIPGMGFYGLGYIHLLGNLQVTLTSTIRSLIDSAQFTNLQGGFIDKRLRIRGQDGPIKPGQFKEVESGGVPLKDLIHPLQFKEPSQVLMQMYQFIEGRAQKFADTTEQIVADSTNYGPVGTTMALLEASNKFFSGVHKRLHNSQKTEFRLLAALNYEYLEEKVSFRKVGESFEVSRSDYSGDIDISPVSDPNESSKSQRMVTSQAIYQAAIQQPHIHNMKEVTKYYYISMDIDENMVDKLLPPEEEAVQADPMTDIVNAQKGKPIAAFPGQDHDSHIAVKTAFLQDPQTGASPVMAPIAPLIQANIQEHIVLKFKEQIAGTMASGEVQQGATEEQIVAQAAQKVAQTNQRMAELEAQGPDAARNKLADAEVLRAINEGAKNASEVDLKQSELTLKALELELKKVQEENKMLLAGIDKQQQQQAQQQGMLEKLLDIAMQEKQQADAKIQQQKQAKVDT